MLVYIALVYFAFTAPHDSTDFGQGKARGVAIAVPALYFVLLVGLAVHAHRRQRSAAATIKEAFLATISIRWWWYKYL